MNEPWLRRVNKKIAQNEARPVLCQNLYIIKNFFYENSDLW
jgi:hypothetical protein